MIEAHAPGKLLIVGEYAVLHGAPAIAAAVDVRARVRIERVGGPAGELLTGLQPAAAFRWSGTGRVHWEDAAPGPNARPLESVLAALAGAGRLTHGGELPACRISIDSGEFQGAAADGRSVKLGLGSSAAVTVALTGALLRLIGGAPLDPGALLGLCEDAHRRLQNGRGSGIDVAAALFGGVIGRMAVPGSASAATRPVSWPGRLHLLAVWTGQGASTPELLHRFEAWQQREPQAFSAHMERMATIARKCVSGWMADDVGAVLLALQNYAGVLAQLDEAAHIGIFSPVHRRLRELCEQRRLAYKPSGAGGGDFGTALGEDPALIEALRRDCEREGLRVLDRPLCPPGLAVTERPDR